MINLPSELLKLQQGNDLRPLKPFAFLYRNKWNPETNKYQLETTPIDITPFLIKPNTLSMTLDVTEVAQYNANNITLTLTDINNRFVEGTPHSYFPEGYQIYGSQVVLYYGINTSNKTSLFVGVIKDLPTYRPENYQVDLKLISPLELLNDIEAKEFSNKHTNEILTANGTDADNNPIYKTAYVNVGGFNTVYADETKLFEGIDFEVKQTDSLYLPALITIKNHNFHSSTIKADYYCWKTGLSIEEIITGLVALGGYISNIDIQPVIWQSEIKNPPTISPVFAALGYSQSGTNEYTFSYAPTSNNKWNTTFTSKYTTVEALWRNIIPENFDYNFTFRVTGDRSMYSYFVIGSEFSSGTNYYHIQEGLYFEFDPGTDMGVTILKIEGAIETEILYWDYHLNYIASFDVALQKRGNTVTMVVYIANQTITKVISYTNPAPFNVCCQYSTSSSNYNRAAEVFIENQTWNFYDDDLNLVCSNVTRPCIITQTLDKNNANYPWGAVNATLTQGQVASALPAVLAYMSEDGNNWSEGYACDYDTDISRNERYLRYMLYIANDPNNYFHIKNPTMFYYASSLTLNVVNLSGKSVLQALQDFSLISGYEFGVDRQGIFFFRPRSQSTTPVYNLGHKELVKIDSINKKFNNFFTKLTLTFAERPLEFYANTGSRPTPIDKYGVINKEIDKPEIINYDNTELAQAIGPQLLSIYSHLSNQLQVTSKLNLALELGDIVNLKRSYPQVVNSEASEQHKYENQQTYYRLCKIIGLNYNFEKKQVSYTLEDVSDETNGPTD